MCRCSLKPVPFEIGDHTIYGTGFGKFGKEGPVSVKGFDLVVLLDAYAGSEFLRASKPWKSPKVFAFEIQDMNVPKDPVEFGKFLDYLTEALQEGKKVLIGCIGGHGRTGLVLAALHHKITGNGQGMKAVRSGYCKKAIESEAQIKWLYDTYGMTKVEASKKFTTGLGGKKDWLHGTGSALGAGGFYRPSKKKGKTRTETPRDLPAGPSSLFDKTLISGKLW